MSCFLRATCRLVLNHAKLWFFWFSGSSSIWSDRGGQRGLWSKPQRLASACCGIRGWSDRSSVPNGEDVTLPMTKKRHGGCDGAREDVFWCVLTKQFLRDPKGKGPERGWTGDSWSCPIEHVGMIWYVSLLFYITWMEVMCNSKTIRCWYLGCRIRV